MKQSKQETEIYGDAAVDSRTLEHQIPQMKSISARKDNRLKIQEHWLLGLRNRIRAGQR
jgi:hypothetical protein